MKRLVILFPGIGYHCDKPLLYYGKRIADAAGYSESINLSYFYEGKNIIGNAAEMEKAFRSLYAQAEEQLRKVDFEQYGEILFMAKSVGTIIASVFAVKHNVKCRMVLYTPLIQTFDQPVSDAAAFIGTQDPWSDVDEVIETSRKQNVPIYTYENANHSLETGDVMQNLDIMKDVMMKTEAFIRNESKLEINLGQAAALVSETLERDAQISKYIQSLLNLRDILLETEEEEINQLDFRENIRMSLKSDRALLKNTITKEADQISLLSTLVTYIACKQTGMPEHSRTYMDRVTQLRGKIDFYYGEKAQQFCGS